MIAFYSDEFVLPLPSGHRFPMSKYGSLRQKVQQILPEVTLKEPFPVTEGQIALAHHPRYIRAFMEGQLSKHQEREIGFPWSPEMVQRALHSAGATVSAARAAIKEGVAFNLAGGTHHAGHAQGGGFCCFNDVAITARLLQAERLARRVAVIDLDVHQGNGTAEILGREEEIFTLSLHGERNYPFKKECSHLDVALPDGCDDLHYLFKLREALDQMLARFAPQFILFIAGADVYESDRLGRLALSKGGIAQRDAIVFALAKQLGVPIAVCMGGGYCPKIEDIVDIHFETVRQGAALWQHWQDE